MKTPDSPARAGLGVRETAQRLKHWRLASLRTPARLGHDLFHGHGRYNRQTSNTNIRPMQANKIGYYRVVELTYS